MPFLIPYLERLRLSCSLVSALDQSVWLAFIPPAPVAGPVQFDSLYGHRSERALYNLENLTRARDKRRTVVAARAGFSDFFVPVVRGSEVQAFLVCGPFRRSLPDRAELLKMWSELTGRITRADDPELFAYARGALGSALLGGELFGVTRRLLETSAKLLADPKALPSFKAFVRTSLHRLDRAPATMHALANGLVDPVRGPTLRDVALGPQYAALGVSRLFSHVVALAARSHAGSGDGLAELVEGRHLLEHGTRVALQIRDTLCGPIGGAGVFFLTSPSPGERIEERVEALRRSVERTLGGPTCAGFSAQASGEHWPQAYDQASLALQLALGEARPVVSFVGSQRRRARIVDAYRQRSKQLCRAVSSGSAAT
ncbi:MAG TPA: hypothetical protein VGP93_13960, partial [Polyangiaceae bacterium]|nr:hypothetical protein [Polyangiaceae bacterium]